MQLHLCTFIGFGISVVGFLGVFILMAKNGGLAFGFRSWTNMGAFLRDPARKGQRRAFFAFLAVLGIGVVFTMGGMMLRDAKERRACRQQCEAAGFDDGRVRGDPHAERPGQTPRMCWCQSGERWADDALGPPPR